MNEFRIHKKLMGCAFELIIFHQNKNEADKILGLGVKEISRIEKLLTEFSEDSLTSEINRNAGIRAVKVPEDVFNLLNRSVKLSEITQGAFDITTGPLKHLYNFRQEKFLFPGRSEILEALNMTGFRNIHLTVIGNRPDGSPWKVGIANPSSKDDMLLYIPVINGSVATSGDYEQFFIRDGIRYSHTIDPRTGMPVKGIQSVTVTGMSAEYCDALATAVTVMGIETGIHFIEQMSRTHCLIIDDANKLHFSKNIIFELSA